jgi:hypothetical protein
MTRRTGRVYGGVLVLALAGWAAGPAGGQEKTPPAKFSGRLMKYDAKKGTITQVMILRPTPKGKTLQDIYNLAVTKETKFFVTDGDEKKELDAKTVLTDPLTKERMSQPNENTTLGNNAGLPVDVETKGKAVTAITFKEPKKKKDAP